MPHQAHLWHHPADCIFLYGDYTANHMVCILQHTSHPKCSQLFSNNCNEKNSKFSKKILQFPYRKNCIRQRIIKYVYKVLCPYLTNAKGGGIELTTPAQMGILDLLSADSFLKVTSINPLIIQIVAQVIWKSPSTTMLFCLKMKYL